MMFLVNEVIPYCVALLSHRDLRPRKKIFVFQVNRPTYGKKSFSDFLRQHRFSVPFSVKETHKFVHFSCFHLILHFYFSYFSLADFFLMKINMYGFLD